MKRSTVRRFCAALALAHLGLVGAGAGHLALPDLGRVGQWLDRYGELTGSSRSYSFFAPGVFGQMRARFEMTDAAGRRTPLSLETGVSHEADLRVGNVIHQFETEVEDKQDFQRSLSASLAAALFNRHPEARAVGVRLESYDSISMDDYRRGVRAEWRPRYEARFVVSPRKAGT